MQPLGRVLLFLSSICVIVLAEKWPYNHRYFGHHNDDGFYSANKSQPHVAHHNLFGEWLHHMVRGDTTGELQRVFVNGSIPSKIRTVDDLLDHLDVPAANASIHPSEILPWPQNEAEYLFKHLPYPLDPRCTGDRTKWWYRTYDGSCNWLKKDEISQGQLGTAKARDYHQYSYTDGISTPREGPNPRAVSNAFFRRKKTIFYEHTPLLLGLIEFIMHDVSYSQDSSTEFINVPMPEDEDYYPRNTTFQVWRTAAVPGTGTSKENPRENINMASTWLDVSSLYGSTMEVARKLRSFTGGKLLVQERLTRGRKTTASYLPFNRMNVTTRTRPGVDPETLFAGGDPRTNEDWVMLGVHTLLLREHNRLCDIVAKQYPEYDDERLYQTVRLVMSAKFALIANSYQMAYWTDKMPWPRDDGFPLYRQMYGKGVQDINPANTYPWPLVTKAGKPMVASAEMAIVYRFHEFIIKSFPIKDALNDTLWDQDLFGTSFNATGFIDTGLENILRGMTATSIPNFKSGVDEAFRSAGKYRGRPFDIVTWSIVHEREQGLPTFNTYFRAYNKQDPAVVVPIRNTFEAFSSDPEAVANLKRLYQTPDEVDLTVGVQLEEEMFPGTSVPKSALIISLFSLFGLGNSDRFSVGFAMMRCLLVDKPWNCHPTNALEELLWAPKPRKGFPNFRFYDTFWLAELDVQAHGTNLLWRLITENTDIKCLQQKPLYPVDPVTNPVLCALPKEKVDYINIAVTGAEISSKLFKQREWEIFTWIAALGMAVATYWWHKQEKKPQVLRGWPIVGEAIEFNKDPKNLLLGGFRKYSQTVSKAFGIRLASLTHYVLTDPADLEMWLKDNPYEVKFSVHEFFRAINAPIITHNNNFESDVHAKLVRTHFGDPDTLARFQETIDAASKMFFEQHPMVPFDQGSQYYKGLNDYLLKYITFIVSRCIVGPDSFDDEQLLKTFIKFNEDAINAMGLASLLPTPLHFLAARSVNQNFAVLRKVLIPVVQRRRASLNKTQSTLPFFLDYILEVADEDQEAADLVAIIVWLGLTNLAASLSSTFLDIVNHPTLQNTILSSLSHATHQNLDTFSSSPSDQWSLLRSSMFESIRLSGSITGPARIITQPTVLPSSPNLTLPKGQAVTLSTYHTHRDPNVWGPNAAAFQHDRFLHADPPVGSSRYLAWGLKGPHACPGQWFGQAVIQILIKELLERYEFRQDREVLDDDKFIYKGGSVVRKEVGVMVVRR